ncbi:MAG: YggS family pyridoxal phosphate-dependent enzyme [Clostridia bacterium]|nr:YggS family pyridoxal phosphate-dependent enzyme [Clostridia bacterium]
MIRENIKKVRDEIYDTAINCGRNPDDITLCAVTKTVDASAAQEVLDSGVTVLGENRVQALLEKYEVLADKPEWHLIGHLQTNKVKYIADKVSLIHSVESLRLAEEIDRRAKLANKIQDVLIEVNVSGEASKFGIRPEDTEKLLEQIAGFSNICVRGLMTIAPLPEKEGENRKYFSKLRELFVDIQSKKYDNSNMDILSMGMSRDYKDAIKEGATIVRVGTALFN